VGWRGLRASAGEFGQRAVAILAPIREPIAGTIVHTLPDTPRHPLAEFQQLGSFRRFWELARSCPRFRLTSEGVSKGSKVPTRECGGRSLVSGRRPAAPGRRGHVLRCLPGAVWRPGARGGTDTNVSDEPDHLLKGRWR